MPISKDGMALNSLSDGEQHAGPKRPNQWVDGRSAKEAARAWLEGDGKALPAEVASVLAAHKAFGPVLSWHAEPEAKLQFDSFAGEPRNSDLVVHVQDSHGPYLIALEAKADEPFGETLIETLADAVERHVANTRSNGVFRALQLTGSLLGPRQASDPLVKDLRYQLLTACAGALCEAERRGVSRALMLIHEFVTDKTTDGNHNRNAEDLNAFVSRVSHGTVATVHAGEICGPFTVPGKPLVSKPVHLFIGKVCRNLRSAGA